MDRGTGHYTKHKKSVAAIKPGRFGTFEFGLAVLIIAKAHSDYSDDRYKNKSEIVMFYCSDWYKTLLAFCKLHDVSSSLLEQLYPPPGIEEVDYQELLSI